MLSHWIETERLHLRPFAEADAEEAHAWFSDPEVMRFIPRGSDNTLEDTCRRIAGYCAHQMSFGFSKWIVLHRETGQPIGDSGLMHLPDGERIELGFRFARPWWGKGLAAEAGGAWIAWFEKYLAGRPLFADVHPEHLRSQRVLARLRFHFTHIEFVFGMTMQIHARLAQG